MIAPAPAPARPRLLMVATALVCGAGAMFVATLIGNYLRWRDLSGGTTQTWLPSGTGNPQVAGATILGVLAGAVLMAMWVRHSIKESDRINGYYGMGALVVFAIAGLTSMVRCWQYMHLEIRTDSTPYAMSVWTLTGGWFALLVATSIYTLVQGFRILGGDASPKSIEGASSLVLVWMALAVTYFPTWYVVFILK
jgi:hypothetical protein